jgi:hypothetical protein
MSRHRALLAVIALVAVACSSSTTRTADRTTTDAVATSDANGAAEATAGPSGGLASGTTNTRAGAPGAARVNASSAGGEVVGRLIPGRGQGITDKTIQIGMVDQGNLNDVFAAHFGFTNPGPSFTDREKGDALIAWMNTHGGIAGRKIAPVWEHYDPENESLDQEVAERCAVYGEDHKVFATAPFGIGWECFSKHGIVAIDGVISQFHQKEYDAAGSYMYSPNAMTTDRVARTYALGLDDIGFLKGHRIGLIYWDWPGWKAAVPTLEAALASRGMKLIEKVEIPRYGDAGTLAQSDSQAANATLRFKTSNIDRVLFFDATSLGPSQFMSHAENQNYRPLYGLHSGMGLEGLATSSTPGFSAPKEQLVGSMAVGWNQIGDTGARGKIDPIRSRCRQIMKDADVYAGEDEPIGMCQTLFFLKLALERSTEVSIAGLRTSIEKLGGAFGAGTGFRTFFGPRRHAGATAYRPLKYANGHYEYFGSVKEVP